MTPEAVLAWVAANTAPLTLVGSAGFTVLYHTLQNRREGQKLALERERVEDARKKLEAEVAEAAARVRHLDIEHYDKLVQRLETRVAGQDLSTKVQEERAKVQDERITVLTDRLNASEMKHDECRAFLNALGQALLEYQQHRGGHDG